MPVSSVIVLTKLFFFHILDGQDGTGGAAGPGGVAGAPGAAGAAGSSGAGGPGKNQFDIITLKNFDLKKNGLPNFSWNAWSSRNAGSCWSSRGTWSTWNNGKINCRKFSFKLKIPTTYFSS
jgi:hypothetical protein